MSAIIKPLEVKKTRFRLLASLLTALASIGALVLLIEKRQIVGTNNSMTDKITAYFPFNFTDPLDPRAVLSVGDQVLSEHVYGAHIRQTMKSGLQPVLSDLIFHDDSTTVEIVPRHEVQFANGTPLSLKEICKAIDASLHSSYHAEYQSILESVQCDEKSNRILIKFRSLPVNLRFLFTLPDLSIYSVSHVPVRENSTDWTTGPYKILSRSRTKIELARNPYYPSTLRANNVERVDLVRYSTDESRHLAQSANPKNQDAIYFYGYALAEEDLGTLRKNGYQVEVFPTEWLVYGGAKGKISQKDRSIFAAAIRQIRESGIVQRYSGLKAYSIAPQDREYGLKTAVEPDIAVGSLSHPYKIVTLKSWASLPFFQELIAALQKRIPNLSLRTLEITEFSELFADQAEFILSPLGISPADPLSHLSFLSSTYPQFDQAITKDQVAALSLIEENTKFVSEVRKAEELVVQSRLLFPIAHFPGIVAVRSDFQRDDSLSFGWGIQAWTFRVP
jgi:hypothetical protein